MIEQNEFKNVVRITVLVKEHIIIQNKVKVLLMHGC